jgi:hypothetical protein
MVLFGPSGNSVHRIHAVDRSRRDGVVEYGTPKCILAGCLCRGVGMGDVDYFAKVLGIIG